MSSYEHHGGGTPCTRLIIQFLIVLNPALLEMLYVSQAGVQVAAGAVTVTVTVNKVVPVGVVVVLLIAEVGLITVDRVVDDSGVEEREMGMAGTLVLAAALVVCGSDWTFVGAEGETEMETEAVDDPEEEEAAGGTGAPSKMSFCAPGAKPFLRL